MNLMFKEKEWDNCPLSGISDMAELKQKAMKLSDDELCDLIGGVTDKIGYECTCCHCVRREKLIEKLKLYARK